MSIFSTVWKSGDCQQSQRMTVNRGIGREWRQRGLIGCGGSFWERVIRKQNKKKRKKTLKFSDNKAGDESQIFNLGER